MVFRLQRRPDGKVASVSDIHGRVVKWPHADLAEEVVGERIDHDGRQATQQGRGFAGSGCCSRAPFATLDGAAWMTRTTRASTLRAGKSESHTVLTKALQGLGESKWNDRTDLGSR